MIIIDGNCQQNIVKLKVLASEVLRNLHILLENGTNKKILADGPSGAKYLNNFPCSEHTSERRGPCCTLEKGIPEGQINVDMNFCK